jgi:hypothetical protein
MAKILKNKIGAFLKSLVTKWLEDIFIFLGIILILITTYNRFGEVIGNYSLGFVLLVLGLVFAKK